MNFTAIVTVPDPQKRIYTLFLPEQKDVVSDRGSFTLAHENEKTIITISATDATALRAVTNGVLKILAVDSKMEDI